MKFIADFHIHSKYSRATSRQMDLGHISKWAKLKGITLVGSGDFTHYLWMRELESKLEDLGNGLFKYDDIYFILTVEISSIYSKGGRSYRIHNLIFAPSFRAAKSLNSALGKVGNLSSDGRPILGLDAEKIAHIAFEIDENCLVVPGHIWTPWFSLFGSMSGFDRIEECFGRETEKIFALETGLSSDPAMNWRLSALDRFSLLSNSDSHSAKKLGREANIFNCDLDYNSIHSVLKTKDKKKFLSTIEFFPEEGKYHFDGHRACGIRFSPEETRQHSGICPICGKAVTRGVLHRVEELADRPEGFVPENSIPYQNLIPLDEIIAGIRGVGSGSKSVEREQLESIAKFDSEFEILLEANEEELKQKLTPDLTQAILRMRQGKVKIQPGFDGEYGKISIYDEKNNRQSGQLAMF